MSFLIRHYKYYLCNQEVEDKTGSAGEQPVSNRLPAICGERLGNQLIIPELFSPISQEWQRKPILMFNESNMNNLL